MPGQYILLDQDNCDEGAPGPFGDAKIHTALTQFAEYAVGDRFEVAEIVFARMAHNRRIEVFEVHVPYPLVKPIERFQHASAVFAKLTNSVGIEHKPEQRWIGTIEQVFSRQAVRRSPRNGDGKRSAGRSVQGRRALPFPHRPQIRAIPNRKGPSPA